VIAGLKPYAEYTDAGHDWLGTLPAHWGQLRAKRLFREVDERSKTGKEELLSVSHLTGVTPRRLKTVTMFMAESNVGHKVCRPGDLVINTLWAWMAALGVTKHVGIVSPAYGVYRPTEGGDILPAYADQLLRTPLYAAEYQRRSTGVNSSRLRLYPEQFLRMPVLVPPLDEQAAIVRFLDWANGRLERAIRAKRKVIALLLEQKQAIVRRAVTRGLDSTAPRKSTGIPWIGEIPEHWEVRRLGSAISILTGYPFASSGFVQRDGAVRLLRGVNVTPSGVRWSSVVKWERKRGDRLEAFELRVGDIVLGMDRPVIGSGVRATSIEGADTPALLLQRVARLRTTEKLHARFLLLLLRGGVFSEYILPIFTGISVPHLSPEQIKGFKVMLPPISEQEAIADSIEGSTEGIWRNIARIEREIGLLREYRTRLVADVVTGKLDVRDAAVRLPDEAATGIEAEPADEADDPEPIDEEAEA